MCPGYSAAFFGTFENWTNGTLFFKKGHGWSWLLCWFFHLFLHCTPSVHAVMQSFDHSCHPSCNHPLVMHIAAKDSWSCPVLARALRIVMLFPKTIQHLSENVSVSCAPLLCWRFTHPSVSIAVCQCIASLCFLLSLSARNGCIFCFVCMLYLLWFIHSWVIRCAPQLG